jgi:phosphomannomutase
MNKNKINWVFDIDGTLTPSRLRIDPSFESFFLKWMEGKQVYLVTGSDAPKTREQVGDEIWKRATRVFQSCGNQIYENGEIQYENPWKPSQELNDYLKHLLQLSECPEKTSNHIEARVGLVNFSPVGRDCTQEQRIRYNEWDNGTQERLIYAKLIEKEFPDLEASVGGQISIDIHPKGANKSQVRDMLEGPIWFFGDKTGPGGNDKPLADALVEGDRVFPVNDPQHTQQLLQELDESNPI